MDGYEIESEPFYTNYETSVSLYRAISLARNRRPVVIKRHYLVPLLSKGIQQLANQALNAALNQAKVQHRNSCDILELHLEVEEQSCVISHILEALDTDLGKDIEERRPKKKHYSEDELRAFLLQVGSALELAHSKVRTM